MKCLRGSKARINKIQQAIRSHKMHITKLEIELKELIEERELRGYDVCTIKETEQ